MSVIIDYGSCLDYVYINILLYDIIFSVILELYFFDYKLIVIYLLKV